MDVQLPMTTIQRNIVNLEIVAEDLQALPDSEHWSEQHIKLIEEYKTALQLLAASLKSETENGFRKWIESSSLGSVLATKKMVSVHLKLIDYVLTYWEASQKANSILDSNFGENADKRLELLQVKAIRAKSQLKTVATAMGQLDYQKFVELLNLRDEQWQWQGLIARF